MVNPQSDGWETQRRVTTGLQVPWASLVAQEVKRLSTMRETWVLSLGREDPLEKEMATHSSILAWRMCKWLHR